MRDLLTWLVCTWALGIVLAALAPVPATLPLLAGSAALGAACAWRPLRGAALAIAALSGGVLGFGGHPDVARPLAGPVEVTLEGRVVRPRLSRGGMA